MHDGPDEHDGDLLDDSGDVIDCPHCGEEVYAYAEQCPHCRTWLSVRHRVLKGIGRARRGWWRWVTVVIVVVIFIVWVMTGM